MIDRKEFSKLYSLSSTGLQSEIDIGIIRGRKVIRKKCRNSLSKDELHLFADCIAAYRKKLNENDFLVPENFIIAVVDIDGGDIFLEVIDEYIDGLTVEQIIRDESCSDVAKIEAWEKMINLLVVNFLSTNDKFSTSVGMMIDAKPDNFVISKKEGRLYCVDLFPPLLRDADKNVYPFKQEIFKRNKLLFTFNYGDIRGQLTKLLALLKLQYENKDCMLFTDSTLNFIKKQIPHFSATEYVFWQTRTNFAHMNIFYSNEQKSETLLRNLLSPQIH